ncbi:hypothetical protein BD310DRAFT_942641 [Dichomitus squalens]|uniref:Uncharacterized protein n=1 Tax=Dichomitus squalens TaxID=114155 RepID=A0A4Q9PDN8_9APHY|nr:hypothetical protein BD310DRAFT_942641 [Dichomitus squalens]
MRVKPSSVRVPKSSRPSRQGIGYFQLERRHIFTDCLPRASPFQWRFWIKVIEKRRAVAFCVPISSAFLQSKTSDSLPCLTNDLSRQAKPTKGGRWRLLARPY